MGTYISRLTYYRNMKMKACRCGPRGIRPTRKMRGNTVLFQARSKQVRADLHSTHFVLRTNRHAPGTFTIAGCRTPLLVLQL